ncbi:MAG: carbon storage regulator [Deltaproteobacteria bacterium]|nr:carbon storage regulator [Deltaproteobacteria bacterium]
MLTLTRRPGQEIRIGDGIRILVKEIRGKQVRLGIEAPPGVPIYREEIYQEIVKEMGQAAQGEFDLLDIITGSEPLPGAKPVQVAQLKKSKPKPEQEEGAESREDKDDN